MKNIVILKTKLPANSIKVTVIALAVALVAVFPEPAYAGCSRWNISCKIREAANRVREAAERSARAAKAAAERAARESKAAAERAAREAQAAADYAAQQAKEQAERLMREAYQKALDEAFARLRDAHLDELANVQKIGDGDFWKETVLKAVMSSLSGLNISDELTASADLLVKGMGTPTAEHPFGDGPFGILVQNQTVAILQQTGTNAINGMMSVMDPTKNPLSGDEIQVQTLSDFFEIELPHPAKFKYEVAAAIKGELGQTIPDKRLSWLDLKQSIQLKVPFIYGDLSETKTAFQSIVKDHRFKFQVALALGVATNKDYDAVVKNKAEVQLAFDVACSTQNIGQCQLQKITVKPKAENKRTEIGIFDHLTKMKIALDTIIDLMSAPLVADILFGSNSDKKREYTNTLAEIRDYVDFSIKVANMTQPPTRHAASNAMVMLNGMGLTDITRGFLVRSQFADALDSVYKFSGKTEIKGISERYSTMKYVYDETAAYESSVSFEYINQDVLENRFRAGWNPVGGEDLQEVINDFVLNLDDPQKAVNNYSNMVINHPKYLLSVLNFIMPQYFGIEVAKVGASEAKLEWDMAKAAKAGMTAVGRKYAPIYLSD